MLMISEKLKDSEDSKMSSPFTEEEIRILKKICDNPIFQKEKILLIPLLLPERNGQKVKV